MSRHISASDYFREYFRRKKSLVCRRLVAGLAVAGTKAAFSIVILGPQLPDSSLRSTYLLLNDFINCFVDVVHCLVGVDQFPGGVGEQVIVFTDLSLKFSFFVSFFSKI